jgi:hypothetical protein
MALPFLCRIATSACPFRPTIFLVLFFFLGSTYPKFFGLLVRKGKRDRDLLIQMLNNLPAGPTSCHF